LLQSVAAMNSNTTYAVGILVQDVMVIFYKSLCLLHWMNCFNLSVYNFLLMIELVLLLPHVASSALALL